MITIPIKLLNEHATLPRNAYGDDAGWDLFTSEDATLWPGEHTNVPTGVAVSIPRGYFGRLVGRSSAIRRGIVVREATIDAGYVGELGLLVWVDSDRDGPITLFAGESIGQLIIQKVPYVVFLPMEELPAGVRGERGFGSSGN